MNGAKKIVLGITGGIAAYKTPELARLLKKGGLDVRVIMTRSAERFVAPLALRSVTGNEVLTADWDAQKDPYDHLFVTRGASAALIAPATANFLSKLAHGVADDLLTTTILAARCPVYVAPSMNPSMLNNPAVRENIRTLERRGINVIPPEVGEMADGEFGEGRLPSVEYLASLMMKVAGVSGDLAGRRILVTAGPTVEPIDAARFISNRSSGKMGAALACAARDRGADVTLIHGPVTAQLPERVRRVAVRTAVEMLDAVTRHFSDCDMLIMAAAVADFRPAGPSAAKIKKGDLSPSLALEPNPDILEAVGKIKGGRVVVGFAAETENLIKNARDKMAAKNMDIICVNDVGREDSGFDSDYNEVTILCRGEEPLPLRRADKLSVANRILDVAVKFLPAPVA